MTPRATVSAVIFVAATLVFVACGGGQPAPATARTSLPTPTANSVPSVAATPTAVAVIMQTSTPTSMPVLTQTPTSAPAPTSNSTAAPVLTPTPASAPAPTSPPTFAPILTPSPTQMPAVVSAPTATLAPPPTPTPVSTQAAMPVPRASYLAADIPPCTPAPGSSVDPCEPGWRPLDATGAMIDVGDVPFGVEYFLEGTSEVSVSHIVLRGTYLPGTVRCISTLSFRPPSYLDFVQNLDRGNRVS